MPLLRMLIPAGLVLIAGACGGNDEDIESEIRETEATPEYVMPENGDDTDPVLREEPTPSREVDEEIIPTPETDTGLDPEISDTDSPEPDVAVEPSQTPEDGMPEDDGLPQ